MLNELFVPLPTWKTKTKIRQPVMPIDFASSAIQQVWPHTQMQASTLHGTLPQTLRFSSLNTKTRGRLSQNSLRIHTTTFVVQQIH